MIYASIKPIEEYDVRLENGEVYGLYQSYGYRPDLLALVMLATPFPYDYEGDVLPLKRRVCLKDISSLEKSLPFEIDGRTLSVILKTLNPIEICKLLRLVDLTTLPMVVKFFDGDPKIVYDIVGARSAAWALSYRGKISTAGKIKRVAFGGAKTVFDILSEDLALHKVLQEKASMG